MQKGKAPYNLKVGWRRLKTLGKKKQLPLVNYTSPLFFLFLIMDVFCLRSNYLTNQPSPYFHQMEEALKGKI